MLSCSTLLDNPLGQLAQDSLPESVQDISFSNISSKAIAAGTLPTSLTRLCVRESHLSGRSLSNSLGVILFLRSIKNCSLEDAPSDIGTMEKLSSLNITGCQLRSFEFTETLLLAHLYVVPSGESDGMYCLTKLTLFLIAVISPIIS
jgi:hypothetical protein